MAKAKTEAEMLELVKKEIKKLGSQVAFAEMCGVKKQYITDIIKGRRAITDAISVPLGYRRAVGFEKIKEK